MNTNLMTKRASKQRATVEQPSPVRRKIRAKPLDKTWREELIKLRQATFSRYESDVPLGGQSSSD